MFRRRLAEHEPPLESLELLSQELDPLVYALQAGRQLVARVSPKHEQLSDGGLPGVLVVEQSVVDGHHALVVQRCSLLCHLHALSANEVLHHVEI